MQDHLQGPNIVHEVLGWAYRPPEFNRPCDAKRRLEAQSYIRSGQV